MNYFKKAFCCVAMLSLFVTGASSVYSKQYQNDNATVIQADIQSLKIPTGTMFKLNVDSAVNSYNYGKGSRFSAFIVDDVRVGNSIALPAGTGVSGYISQVKKSGYFSKPGELMVRFDHLVTPYGRQIPFSARILDVNGTPVIGHLSGGGGYVTQFKGGIDHGADVFTNVSMYCVNKGLSFGKGVPVLLTAPIGVVSGAAAGSLVFFSDSFTAMIKKGQNVIINPGTIFTVAAEDDIDIPLN